MLEWIIFLRKAGPGDSIVVCPGTQESELDYPPLPALISQHALCTDMARIKDAVLSKEFAKHVIHHQHLIYGPGTFRVSTSHQCDLPAVKRRLGWSVQLTEHHRSQLDMPNPSYGQLTHCGISLMITLLPVGQGSAKITGHQQSRECRQVWLAGSTSLRIVIGNFLAVIPCSAIYAYL